MAYLVFALPLVSTPFVAASSLAISLVMRLPIMLQLPDSLPRRWRARRRVGIALCGALFVAGNALAQSPASRVTPEEQAALTAYEQRFAQQVRGSLGGSATLTVGATRTPLVWTPLTGSMVPGDETVEVRLSAPGQGPQPQMLFALPRRTLRGPLRTGALGLGSYQQVLLFQQNPTKARQERLAERISSTVMLMLPQGQNKPVALMSLGGQLTVTEVAPNQYRVEGEVPLGPVNFGSVTASVPRNPVKTTLTLSVVLIPPVPLSQIR